MRVVIAEDAALLREGLTRLLEDRGHAICAAVPDGDALLAAVAEHRPDVAVVDIRMPPTHSDEGLRAALKLRHDFPRTGVLVFSQYIETSYSAQLLEGGAAGVGYLLKDRVANVAEFSAALQRVADGGTALDPEVVSQLFRASRQRGGLTTLTPRERQVLALMAEGRSNAGIAAELVVSGGAVEKHVASIFTKLGLPPDESDNRRVLAVLRHLGGPAVIVGHSISGGAATIAAAMEPELVSGIVEINPFTKTQKISLGGLLRIRRYRQGMTRLLGTQLLRNLGLWMRYLDVAYPAKPADYAEYMAALAAKLREPGRMAEF